MPSQPLPAQLNLTISNSVSLDELNGFCLELNLDFENLPPATKKEKVNHLVSQLYAKKRLPELLAILEKERTQIHWQELADQYEMQQRFLKQLAPLKSHHPRHLENVIGREVEKQALLKAWRDVVDSKMGRTVALMGAYGTGKLALGQWLEEMVLAQGGFAHYAQLKTNDPFEFKQFVRDEAHQYPILLVVDRLEVEPTLWLDILYQLADEIRQAYAPLPILMLIIQTSSQPLSDFTKEQHTEPSRFIEKLAQDKLADVLFLPNEVTESEIEAYISPTNSALLERLYDLSAGDPLVTDIIWREWVSRGLVQVDEQGMWQAVSGEDEKLTVYGSVADQARELLANHLDGWEELPPFDVAETERILNCAAMEGELFTVEAVAEVLELDRDVLENFFDEFLAPYEDEEDPDFNMPGIVESVDEIAVDPYRTVQTYRFIRPYLYFVWRRTPVLEKQRREWSLELGWSLEKLYYPNAARITTKLAQLFTQAGMPGLARPYQERREAHINLTLLRNQVKVLLEQEPEVSYEIYRLLELGLQLSGELTKNQQYAKEGIKLAEDLLPYAVVVEDEIIEADVLYYQVFHMLNGGQYAEGVPIAERVLAIREKALGPEHPDTAQSLNNLGGLLRAMGDLAESRPYYERALAINEKALGPEHPVTATSLGNLGGLLQALGDLAGARPYYEQALAIREKVLGPEHPDTASSLNNLGLLLLAMGDLAESRPYYERALAIREKVLGPDHPDTATSLNNLGGLLKEMGDLAGARPYYERALAIREKVLGPAHPDTAQSLNNLGGLLRAMGDLEGARPYYERALAIREKALGSEHPDTAASLNNLGGLLKDMGDLAGARPYYERALAIREKVLGPDHPGTAASLNNLGALLQAMGDLAEARPYYERALAIREKVLGQNHPDLAYPLNNLGMLLEALGDLTGAQVQLTRALVLFENGLGAEHPNTQIVRRNLAVLDAKLEGKG